MLRNLQLILETNVCQKQELDSLQGRLNATKDDASKNQIAIELFKIRNEYKKRFEDIDLNIKITSNDTLNYIDSNETNQLATG